MTTFPSPAPSPAATAAARRTAAPEHVVVALSGGVDSAVAALLLREQGFEVSALFMKNWEEDDRDGYCAAERDLRDADAVCAALGIPLRAANFASEYWEQVFTPFLREYRAGRTPNPDVLCNREIKFDVFLEFARDLGADRIATGHYARVRHRDGGWHLLKGADPDKDQSYFLHTLGRPALERVLFPLGELCKSEVRARARDAGLGVHDKKDSTGICFIGERRFRDFLARFLPPQPGPIESGEGRIVGTHQGLMYYTLGQRQGLGLGGRRGGNGAPWYVVAKDTARNVLVVAQGRDDPRLHSRRLGVRDPHWVAGAPPSMPLSCAARIRHRQPDQRCRLVSAGDARVEVEFEAPQWAATPGQSAVFYLGEECLGGGVIDSAGE